MEEADGLSVSTGHSEGPPALARVPHDLACSFKQGGMRLWGWGSCVSLRKSLEKERRHMRSQPWLTDPFPGLSSLDFPLYFISYLFLVQSNSCFLLTFFQGQVKKSKEEQGEESRSAETCRQGPIYRPQDKDVHTTPKSPALV